MRILANENFPGDAVRALRASGHDVVWVREENPGNTDSEILAQAQREERLLITFDKDFGELAFRMRLPALQGIILFRISAPTSVYVATRVVEVISLRSDWYGHFSVVDDISIRMTPLPTS
jgi:predicted nuclease of predicted toxin-antitoxin system